MLLSAGSATEHTAVACTRGERCLAMAGRCVTVAQAAGTEPRVPTPAPPPNTKGPFFEASHLLIQYAGAKRAADTVTRSKEEARVLATRLTVEAKQQGPSGFAALVGQHSDEPGAARRGGSLGRFASKHMVKPFSDAVANMAPGTIDGPVETDFGFHIIWRQR